ncbi:tRNA pseudouridine(13) synthase TruD [Helicobacter cappadocius]|uniref:tRNA pseudouridine synthase D n=1 Tax=Helicobacter cappadocius TaxID=3063998 RepID=A0AA90PIV1_9HELI|nr:MULTISPECIES: tRNA pseudouridine(13) synthase TruD [unclassified Helicobacter]MDO7252768.1 tRNA pseudouridine(13) synthase TruD [Helicobacter sp. faydin-H75]MDP2538636.1 tRNA pseudouridine(13) synthase TruD [Helicobacter sp. faydin-H76]
MNKIYSLNHSPIDFHFSQNPRDFIVREVPLYHFSNEGEHHILNVRKKGLNTIEMINIFSSILGIKSSEIGYSGLKDKNAMTSQYISINKKFTQNLDSILPLLEEKNIKILSCTYHNNKLKIGHLKGNNFFIRLKKVTPSVFEKINSVLKIIEKNGLPNYFGYQRFGKDGENFLEGQKIVRGELKIKNKRMSDFLISSYQSFLFNQWLNFRVKISKIFQAFEPQEILQALCMDNIFSEYRQTNIQNLKTLDIAKIKSIKNQPSLFKLFEGDIMHHYPYGKVFELETQNDISRFFDRNITPTGLLSGKKVLNATKVAGEIETCFIDKSIHATGTRRFAWIWIENLKYNYIQENAWLELEFFLPKGSYATTLIEEIAHRNVKID